MMKIEEIYSSETPVLRRSTRRQIPEDGILDVMKMINHVFSKNLELL
jgi:hypothetical protein